MVRVLVIYRSLSDRLMFQILQLTRRLSKTTVRLMFLTYKFESGLFRIPGFHRSLSAILMFEILQFIERISKMTVSKYVNT